jgi:hypothetical protein
MQEGRKTNAKRKHTKFIKTKTGRSPQMYKEMSQ